MLWSRTDRRPIDWWLSVRHIQQLSMTYCSISEDNIEDIFSKDVNYRYFPTKSGYAIQTDLKYAVRRCHRKENTPDKQGTQSFVRAGHS